MPTQYIGVMPTQNVLADAIQQATQGYISSRQAIDQKKQQEEQLRIQQEQMALQQRQFEEQQNQNEQAMVNSMMEFYVNHPEMIDQISTSPKYQDFVGKVEANPYWSQFVVTNPDGTKSLAAPPEGRELIKLVGNEDGVTSTAMYITKSGKITSEQVDTFVAPDSSQLISKEVKRMDPDGKLRNYTELYNINTGSKYLELVGDEIQAEFVGQGVANSGHVSLIYRDPNDPKKVITVDTGVMDSNAWMTITQQEYQNKQFKQLLTKTDANGKQYLVAVNGQGEEILTYDPGTLTMDQWQFLETMAHDEKMEELRAAHQQDAIRLQADQDLRVRIGSLNAELAAYKREGVGPFADKSGVGNPADMDNLVGARIAEWKMNFKTPVDVGNAKAMFNSMVNAYMTHPVYKGNKAAAVAAVYNQFAQAGIFDDPTVYGELTRIYSSDLTKAGLINPNDVSQQPATGQTTRTPGAVAKIGEAFAPIGRALQSTWNSMFGQKVDETLMNKIYSDPTLQGMYSQSKDPKMQSIWQQYLSWKKVKGYK